MNKKNLLLFIAVVALFSGCSCNAGSEGKGKSSSAKNVIYMIGDGMGLNQVYAAMTANGGTLNIERCTHTGIVKTYSANSYITDSAAGGTALATGNKTNNGMLGMTPDSLPVQSVLEYYCDNGLAVGFVVTSPAYHATPASFYAHCPDRSMSDVIVAQLYNSDIDFFAGGGRRYFEAREDGLNYSDSLRSKGYTIAYGLDEISSPVELPFGIIAADIDLPTASLRGDFLPDAVELAIQSLDAKAGDKGFFLMVEGSQIDYRCHGNDGPEAVKEVLDFDNAVKKALDFAEADGNTLVVITADHETGGMTIVNGSYSGKEVTLSFGTEGKSGTSVGHTGTMVPVYAFGPGAERFTGILENTDIPKLITNNK